MLQLKNIKKDYALKGQEPVHALRGISLNFRKSEFVSILGPSGCGKTTLLNIVGGLDRYTSGDLLIKNQSTKEYKDGDWDTYRNHSIGFVFQSYNLISHQNIIKNVELALTISGVSREERHQRALEALDKVGLKAQAKKKPNQLSGGQMQRVAIARALVNNPEILLADEPTGALDSETSIQVMDLLKEVAKDRLVIMVTHNPDLAMKYSTRIVNMFDGEIIGDSNPFDGKNEVIETDNTNKGRKKQSSMSFKTALGLSFSNLISKRKRTALVAVAGSIGIIGISCVLALSHGVKNYINGMQDDMLSSYPLTISEESVDYTSLMSGLSNLEKDELAVKAGTVGVDSMIAYLMDKYQDITSVKTNTIDDNLLDYIAHIPNEYLSSLSYDYKIDVTNNIFTEFKFDQNSEKEMVSLNGLTQRYIATLKTVNGFSEYAKYVDLFTDFMNQLPGTEDYIMSQYDALIGKFPTQANELLLVVDNNTTLTDILLAQMGVFTQEEFMHLAQYAIESNKDNPDPAKLAKYSYPKEFEYEKLIGKKMTYYPHATIWESMSIPTMVDGEIKYLDIFKYPAVAPTTWNNGLEMKITGILKAKETTKFGSLSRGLYYTPELTKKYMSDAINSDIVSGEKGITKYLGKETESPFMGLVTFDYMSYADEANPILITGGSASALNADFSASLGSLFAAGSINYTEVDLIYLRSLAGLHAQPNADGTSYDCKPYPQRISIYPKDFALKDKITDYLDQWNKEGNITLSNNKVLTLEDRDELTYTDTISVIVAVINTLIDAITIALVSFTSLSLVVSCFMIAVITYISVMERVKEIGIIRSVGGRKKDVSRLFIAETFIIGLCSGFIGVGITYVISAILNIIIAPFGVGALANLPLYSAGIMIALSFVLTVLSGLIPSQKASHQDPVIALRSE